MAPVQEATARADVSMRRSLVWLVRRATGVRGRSKEMGNEQTKAKEKTMRDESADIVIAKSAVETVHQYSGHNVNVAPAGRPRAKPETHQRYVPIEQYEELERRLEEKDPTP